MATVSGGGGGGAIVAKGVFDAQPAIGGIRSFIGALGGLTSALTLASGAMAGLITKAAIDEVVAYEEEVADLAKLLGRPVAEPIAESIAEMSTTVPLARRELSAIAEQAARFGIRGRDNILEFTRVIAEMSVATDASAEQAAEAMVKIATITGEPISSVRDMGNALNELSNVAATSFSELISSAGQLAPVLEGLDVPTSDLFALAAATNEVNISVRRGARRLRSFFQGIQDPRRLAEVADILKISSKDLTEALEEDPLELMGLLSQKMREGGEDARALSSAFNRAAGQGVQSLANNLDRAVEFMQKSKDQMAGGSSLADEYAERVNTAAAKQQLLSNRINEAQRELGEGLLPLYKDALEVTLFWADALGELGIEGRLDEILPEERAKALGESMKKAFLTSRRGLDALNTAVEDFITAGGAVPVTDAFNAMISAITQGGIKLKSTNDIIGGLTDRVFTFANSLDNAAQAAFFIEQVTAFFQRLEDSNAEMSLTEINQVIIQYLQAANKIPAVSDDAGDGVVELGDKYKELAGSVQGATEATVDILKSLVDERDAAEENLASLQGREWALIRSKLAAEGASQAAINHARALFQESQALDRAISDQERLNEMFDEFDSIREPLNRAREAGRDFLQGLREQNIEMMFGAEAAELYRIRMMNILPSQKRAAEAIVRTRNRIKEQNETLEEMVQKSFAQSRAMNEMGASTITEGELMADMFRDLSREFFDFVETAIDGSESVGDALVGMIQRVASALAEKQLQNLLMSFAQTLFGGGFSNPIPTFGDIVNQGIMDEVSVVKRASGGSLHKGQLALVGEKGPEFFVPDMSGTVIPNDAIRKGGSSGSVVINVSNNIDLKAMDGKSVQRVLKDQIEFISGETVRTIRNHESLLRQLR